MSVVSYYVKIMKTYYELHAPGINLSPIILWLETKYSI